MALKGTVSDRDISYRVTGNFMDLKVPSIALVFTS